MRRPTPDVVSLGLLLLVGAGGCNMITGAGDLEVVGNGGASGSEATTESGATSGQGATSGPAATSGAGAGATTGNTTSGAGPAGSGGASTSTSAATTSASMSAAQSSAAASSSSGQSNDAAQLCVDTINMYRATLGLPPYARWTAEEVCADDQSMQDSQSMQAHGAFGQCSENAQNECPGWPGPPENMITGCLQVMWAEGPGDFQNHGHYINMSNPQYTKVACGFYTLPNGDVWAVQDFKP